MRGDAATRSVAQLMLERFRKSFHAGLGDVVGGIAGRGGDALLRAGVDDEPRPAPRDHVGREDARAVDEAPHVDADDALPVVGLPEHRAPGPDAPPVHADPAPAPPPPPRPPPP